jgi:hypothetical protein
MALILISLFPFIFFAALFLFQLVSMIAFVLGTMLWPVTILFYAVYLTLPVSSTLLALSAFHAMLHALPHRLDRGRHVRVSAPPRAYLSPARSALPQ